MNNSSNSTKSFNTKDTIKIKFSLEGESYNEILNITKESFSKFDSLKRELNEDLKKKKRKYYDELDDFMYKMFLISDNQVERTVYVITNQEDLDKIDILESLKSVKSIKIEYKFNKMKENIFKNNEDLKKYLYRKNLYILIQYNLMKSAISNNEFKEYIKKEYLSKNSQVNKILGCSYIFLKEQIAILQNINKEINENQGQGLQQKVSDNANLEHVTPIMFELSSKKINNSEIGLDEEFQSKIDNREEEIYDFNSKVFGDDDYVQGYSIYFSEKESLIKEGLMN